MTQKFQCIIVISGQINRFYMAYLEKMSEADHGGEILGPETAETLASTDYPTCSFANFRLKFVADNSVSEGFHFPQKQLLSRRSLKRYIITTLYHQDVECTETSE